MPSSATTRNRFEKQATGENTNTWGSKLNATAFDLIDAALDGRATFTLFGTKALSSTNFAADEARMRFLDITSGTGGTVTLPAVEKWYIVRNKASGNVIFTTGGTTNATVGTNQIQFVVTDGTSVYSDTTVSTAAGYAAAAAASATSINDGNLVHIAGAETVSGVKTFSAGIIINGQTLSAVTATGKSLVEAANAAALRSAADAQAHHITLDSLSGLTLSGNGLKNVRVNSGGTALELSAGPTLSTLNADQTGTTTLSAGGTTALTSGKHYRVTVRGHWKASGTTGLKLDLSGSVAAFIAGEFEIWSSATTSTRAPISSTVATCTSGNAFATNTAYPYVVSAILKASSSGSTFSVSGTNSAGAVSISLLADTTTVIEQLD